MKKSEKYTIIHYHNYQHKYNKVLVKKLTVAFWEEDLKSDNGIEEITEGYFQLKTLLLTFIYYFLSHNYDFLHIWIERVNSKYMNTETN